MGINGGNTLLVCLPLPSALSYKKHHNPFAVGACFVFVFAEVALCVVRHQGQLQTNCAMYHTSDVGISI